MVTIPVIGVGLIGQFLKFCFHSVRERRWRPSSIVAFESFPNFHPLVAGGLCYQVGDATGWGSPMTALSIGLTGVIIYDTSGMKRAAGRQASILKRIGRMQSLEYGLSELLGQSPVRTWIAILAGAMLGILVERSWLALFAGP